MFDHLKKKYFIFDILNIYYYFSSFCLLRLHLSFSIFPPFFLIFHLFKALISTSHFFHTISSFFPFYFLVSFTLPICKHDLFLLKESLKSKTLSGFRFETFRYVLCYFFLGHLTSNARCLAESFSRSVRLKENIKAERKMFKFLVSQMLLIYDKTSSIFVWCRW